MDQKYAWIVVQLSTFKNMHKNLLQRFPSVPGQGQPPPTGDINEWGRNSFFLGWF